MFSFKNISIQFNKKVIFDHFNWTIREKGIHTIVGKNGAGKSTLIKSIVNVVPYKGVIFYQDKNIKRYKNDLIAYLPQDYRINANISVLDLFLLSLNSSNQKFFVQKNSFFEIETILKYLKIEHLIDREYNSLSGGEAQMIRLATALIKKPKILILDEPTSSLDISNVINFLSIIYEYSKINNILVINILHDLNLAVQYSDYIAILHEGKILRYSNREDSLDGDIIKKVFNIETEVIKHHEKPYFLCKYFK